MAHDIMPDEIKKKVKPCPFCGSKDHLSLTMQENFEKIQSESKDNTACIRISCNQCSLDLYEHTHDIHDYNVRLELLLIKWNNRKEIAYESEKN